MICVEEKRMEKKLFVFDIGGVVVIHDSPIVGFCKKYNLPYEEVRNDWKCYLKPMLDGYLEVDSFYRMLELNYGVDLSNDPIMVTYYNPKVNTFMLDVISWLRANGHRVVSGSNTFAPHWNYLLDMNPSPLGVFDHLYASHEMHLSKPNPAFYRYIYRSEGYAPGDSFFIDDAEENIRTAESVGMNAFRYTQDNQALLNYLKPYIS